HVGVLGVDTGTPLINQPECAILATGAIALRPWVVDGQLAVRSLMTLSLSFDHRIVDGAGAARFLDTVRALVEAPALLAACGWPSDRPRGHRSGPARRCRPAWSARRRSAGGCWSWSRRRWPCCTC